MASLVLAIHVWRCRKDVVDGRDEGSHDAGLRAQQCGRIPMRQWWVAVMTAVLTVAPAPIDPVLAQDRSQGRSMIISQYGVVAAEQPIGTRAGTAILERGGNAADAAVAANAAMGLV